MLLFFRCTTFVGVCVEFVAAMAWLAELFPDPKQRERVLGYTQVFSSFGGILVAMVNDWIVTHATQLARDQACPIGLRPSGHDCRSARRLAIHADVRPDPGVAADHRSAVSCRSRRRGKRSGRPARSSGRALANLFAPDLRRTTIVTTMMFACSFGVAFGAIQQIPQIVPGVARRSGHASLKRPKDLKEADAKQATGKVVQEISAEVSSNARMGRPHGPARCWPSW